MFIGYLELTLTFCYWRGPNARSPLSLWCLIPHLPLHQMKTQGVCHIYACLLGFLSHASLIKVTVSYFLYHFMVTSVVRPIYHSTVIKILVLSPLQLSDL